MTRVIVCGSAFDLAVDALGLERVEERPDLVLVDLRDGAAVDAASAIGPAVPRIAIAAEEHERVLRAAGSGVAIASSPMPAVIGPLVVGALPQPPREATRLIAVTGPCGGCGRTMLVAGLAARLGLRASVLVVDATGTGAAGWWLGLAPGPWSDLEGLVDELTSEHLGIVAAEQGRIRVVGGTSAMPSLALLLATVRAAAPIADVTIVDTPSLFDERTRGLMVHADRVLLLATEDAVSLGALDGTIDDDRVWLIASRTRADRIGPHAVFRSLPDDVPAVRAASRGPSAMGGGLGRAYDELADLLALDIT